MTKIESLRVHQAFLREIIEKARDCDVCADQYKREEETNILNDFAELLEELDLIIMKFEDYRKD